VVAFDDFVRHAFESSFDFLARQKLALCKKRQTARGRLA
jgi:hypothetical protein